MASSNQTKEKLFDPLRTTWLIRKKEEGVRQALLKYMTEKLGYPKEWILVEKTLSRLPHLQQKNETLPNRRLDIVCFFKEEKADTVFSPLLAIECKYNMIDIAAFQQLFGYNHYLQAPYLAVVCEGGVLFRYYNEDEKAYHFLNYLPNYSDLLATRQHANKLFIRPNT